jgi:hypothetical protein
MADPRFFVRASADAPEKGPFSLAQIKESHKAQRLKDEALVRPDDGSFPTKTVSDLLKAEENERAAMLVAFARQDEAAQERREKKTSNTKVVLGVVCILAGGGASAASYTSASTSAHGGQYILFYGLVIFGIAQIVRGLMRR